MGLDSMRKVLVLDYDHTLYPASLPTLKAVDDRITLYIQERLGLSPEAADDTRRSLSETYGTTLRGLELHHGVDRHHYCDFVNAVEAAELPVPDPALEAWLSRMGHPAYIFTNARKDWAVRGLESMGLGAFLPVAGFQAGVGAAPGRFREIFDIAFVDWVGKPHPDAFAKVDRRLRDLHGEDVRIHFADDRADNLETARALGWSTLWITPEPFPSGHAAFGFDRVLPSLILLDPDTLD